MDKNAEKVWGNCLKIIKDIVEWQHFKTWFEPIQPVSLKQNVLVIQVPSQFFFEYLEEHYVNLLAKTLKRELGKEARLEYRIMVDSGSSRTIGWNVVTSGGSTASTNQIVTGTSIANASISSLSFHIVLSAGDFIVINTNAGTATQSAWVVVLEL